MARGTEFFILCILSALQSRLPCFLKISFNPIALRMAKTLYSVLAFLSATGLKGIFFCDFQFASLDDAVIAKSESTVKWKKMVLWVHLSFTI